MSSFDAAIAAPARLARLPALAPGLALTAVIAGARFRAAAHSRRRDAQPDDPGGSSRRRPAQCRRSASRRARGRRLLAALRAALLHHPAWASDHGGPGRRAWRRRPRHGRRRAAFDAGFHHPHRPRARRVARAGAADRRRHVDLRRLGGARGKGRDGRRRRGRRLCGRLRDRVRHAGDVRLSAGGELSASVAARLWPVGRIVDSRNRPGRRGGVPGRRRRRAIRNHRQADPRRDDGAGRHRAGRNERAARPRGRRRAAQAAVPLVPDRLPRAGRVSTASSRFPTRSPRRSASALLSCCRWRWRRWVFTPISGTFARAACGRWRSGFSRRCSSAAPVW